MHIAMTGKYMRRGWNHIVREDVIYKIENLGHIFDKSVTKKTNILLCQNPYQDTVKMRKARENGIEIVSYDWFFDPANETTIKQMVRADKVSQLLKEWENEQS